MSTKLSIKPTQHAITRSQAKAQLRIKSDEVSEDKIIDIIILVATRVIEKMARRQFVTATYIKSLDEFQDDRNIKHPEDNLHHHHHNGDHNNIIILEHPPLQELVSIDYIDVDGNQQSVDLNDVQVDTFKEPGRIAPAFGKSWPAARKQFSSVLITYKAGFGDDASFIPDDIRGALLILISHYFDNRDLVLTTNDVEQIEFPTGLSTIIDQFALPEFE